MLSTFNEKAAKPEGLTVAKCNILFLSIGELSKIMPVAFHDSKIAKKLKLSEVQVCYLTKFGLSLNKCSKVNKL